MRDLRVAFRIATRRPWLTASVVGLLGGALAVNTALYSALHLFVLRDLPVRDSPTLAIVESEPGRPVSQSVLDYLEGHPAFDSVGGVVAGIESTADPGVFVARATTSMAAVLGVPPARGTWLSHSAPEGVVIAWSLWQARFGGTLDILGKSLDIGGRRRTLVGVMPPGFDFPFGTNVWELATRPTDANYAQFASLTAIARLRGPDRPETVPLGAETLSLVPFTERYAPSRPQALTLLLVGAALVLGLTVLHLTALGLAQVTRQRSDAAIRLALGAERRHLVRQTLADAAVPVLGGLLFAFALTPPIQAAAGRWLPPEILRGSTLMFDWRTFAAGSILACLVLIIISAVRVPMIPWRNPREALGASGVSHPVARRMARSVLIVQTTCAVTLLYLCGLAVTSLQTVQQVDLGFTPSRLMVVRLPWGTTPLDVQRSLLARVEESLVALGRMPGVVDAVPTMAYPFSVFRGATVVKLPDNTTSRVEVPYVGPGYFDIIGARMWSGRDFAERDSTPPLRVVVNHTLAQSVMRDGVLPRTVEIGGLPHEIIGVVDDVRMWRPELAPGFQAYVSIVERRVPARAILVRTNSEAVSADMVAAAVQGLWTDQPGRVEIEVVQETIHRLMAPQRTRAVLMSGLALSGLLLTLGALTGGLVESVRSRRREIAVRIALGARSGRIVRGLVGDALLVIVAGLCLGLVLGVAALRTMPGVFPGSGAVDVQTVLVVAATFLIVAIIGSVRAAVMACRVDPAAAFKAE